MNDTNIEQLIQYKQLNAPRVTPEGIDSKIVSTTYTILPSGKVMICELILTNGFSVRGEAATVSKANFDEEVAQIISLKNAKEKIWRLEGYLLQEILSKERQ
jgi:hypothetical protein